MKTAMWMLAALAACVASRANADGVCYDPDHGTGKNGDSVRADMADIKAKGFSHVRTYISKLGGIDMADIVANAGLRVALGVPYPDGDFNDHIANAAKAANRYGTVDYIFVGNENLAGQGSVPQSMFDAIADVRKKAPGVKVGTVQRTAEFVHPPGRMAELVQACDFVGVNIHPWFTGGLNGNNAIDQTKAQWNAVLNSGLPGISGKLVLTETGWPSKGSYAGNVGTPESAKTYFGAYKSWATILPDNKKFYFQYFDTPYKGGGYEAFYGIVTYDNKDKFGAGGNPAPTPAPTPVPTTPAPTTPAPTTPAPTTPAPTTVEPSANSTSSTSGSASVDETVLKSSTSGSAETGVTGSAASESTQTESNAENEAGVLDNTSTETKATGAAGDSTDATGAEATGGNADGTTEANVKSSDGGSSIAGVLVVAAFGCAAVGAAFAFIWKARQKAMELDDAENKSFDGHLSMTPGGACAL